MEMCSKGIPTIENVQLKNDYPSDSEKNGKNKKEFQGHYPAECGPSLFW